MKAKKVICFCVLIVIMVCLVMVLSRRINLDSQKKDAESEVSVEVENVDEVVEKEDAEDVASEEETTEPEALYYGWFEELLKTADLEVTSKPVCYVIEPEKVTHANMAVGYNIGKLTEALPHNPICVLEYLVDKDCFAKGEDNKDGEYSFIKTPISSENHATVTDVGCEEDPRGINPIIPYDEKIEKDVKSDSYEAEEIMENIFRSLNNSFNPWGTKYVGVVDDFSLEKAEDCLYKYVQIRSEDFLILLTIYFKYEDGKLSEVSCEVFKDTFYEYWEMAALYRYGAFEEELYCTVMNYLASVEYAVTGDRKMYELFTPYMEEGVSVLPDKYMIGDSEVTVECYDIQGIYYGLIQEKGNLFKYKIKL